MHMRASKTVDQIGNSLPLPTKQEPKLAPAPLEATPTIFRSCSNHSWYASKWILGCIHEVHPGQDWRSK